MTENTANTTRKRVRIHYKGSFAGGDVFIDKTKGEPVEIVVGGRALPDALDRAIAEMKPGEERSVEAPKAYGEYHQEAVRTKVLRYKLPKGDQLQEGMELMWTGPANPGMPVPARIVRADEYSVDIDFNHPLAGKDLVYWVRLVEVLD